MWLVLVVCVAIASISSGDAPAVVVGEPAPAALGSRDRGGALPQISSAPETREFYRGHLDYDGVADAFILDDESPPAAHGAEQMLHAKESSWGTKRILIRFDLAEIAHYYEIVDAQLLLYVEARYGSGSTTLGMHRLLRPWSEDSVTWASTGLGPSWAVPGAGGSGVDHEAAPIASQQITQDRAYVSVDVTGPVQDWVRQPANNYGLLALQSSSTDVRIWSSEVPRDAQIPRLVVTYRLPPDVTPEPTFTPTSTYTPTPGPTPTPTPANQIRSYGKVDSQGWDCIETFVGAPATTDVLLVWQGEATSAKLSFYHQNNYPNPQDGVGHHVLLNGTRIGTLPTINYSSKCTDVGLATRVTFEVDPALLRKGLNEITAVCDEVDHSGWSLADPVIEVGGFVQSAGYDTVEVSSTYDTTTQRATIQTPIGLPPDTAAPLLVALHGWGGDDYEGLKWVGQAANDRGWLLACPWIRGGSDHTASKAVQRDIIDLIDYLIASPDYAVDPSRVYLMGRSMGGMIAATTAAKYPDRFAALVEQSGPSDLASWYHHLCSKPAYAFHCGRIATELNGFPHTVPFDYQRRSAASMPMNLRHVPVLIVHGREDQVVPFEHGSNFRQGLEAYRPEAVSAPVQFAPYDGGHEESHPDWPPEEMLGFLDGYSLASHPISVTIRTDEKKGFYWFDIGYNDTDHWSVIDAAYDPDAQVVTVDARDGRAIPVALDITLQLAELGLPTNVEYTVEEVDEGTGAFRRYTSQAGPMGLMLRVPRGSQYRLVTYPTQGSGGVAPPPIIETLRQDTGGYSGMQDTYIEVYAPSANHATDPLYLSAGGNRSALVRFDLDHIPEDSVVKAAQLGLYAYYSSSAGASLDVAGYRLQEGWDEGSATWKERSSGISWDAAGALSPGSDYEPNAYAPRRMLSKASTWYRFNVTEMVRGWVRDRGRNHGLVFRAEGGNGTYYASSGESQSNRPELIVVYTDPTPTRTPTATATPSPTATRWGTAFLPLVAK